MRCDTCRLLFWRMCFRGIIHYRPLSVLTDRNRMYTCREQHPRYREGCSGDGTSIPRRGDFPSFIPEPASPSVILPPGEQAVSETQCVLPLYFAKYPMVHPPSLVRLKRLLNRDHCKVGANCLPAGNSIVLLFGMKSFPMRLVHWTTTFPLRDQCELSKQFAPLYRCHAARLCYT